MPMIRIETNKCLSESESKTLAQKASALVAKELKKPETYVMAIVAHADAMTMAGDASGICAFCAVKSIGGLTPDRCKALSSAMCGLLEREIGVPSDRIYLNFMDVPAATWGWDGTTFG